MAISDKIRSIETHLRADYKSLEKLGETATNKNIENIAGLVDSIYDKFPKTSYAEGTEITLSNTLKGKLDFENDIVGYGDTTQAIIPSEYQQVEYIESTGPAYIDTGFIPNTNTKIDIEFETIALGTYGTIFGGEDNYSSNAFHLYSSSNNFDIGFGARYTAETIPYSLNTKYTLVMDKTGLTLNSTTGTFSTNTISTNNSIFLFAVNRGTSKVIDSNAQKRIYYCKLYDNGTLVRNMIPCYRISDNVIGMYDIVNNTFYTNAGTGTFTKGNNAPTPTTLIPIKTVTGEQEIIIRGNNKLKINDVTLTSNGVTLTVQDNYLILNGTNNGTESVFQLSNYITPFKTNANTKLKAFQISGTASGSLTNTFFRTYSNWSNQVNVNFTQTAISNYSAELTYNICMLALAGGTYTDYKIGIMVADNLTSDDIFEPYKEPKTYQLSLGEYELYKDGFISIEDDGWYVNNYYREIEADDTLTWSMDSNESWAGNRFTCQNLPSLGVTTQTTFTEAFSNYAKIGKTSDYTSNLNVFILRYINNRNRIDCIFDLESVEELKSILANNPMKILFKGTELIKTPITDTTLIEQLNNWYNSQSFTGTTIITSNGDLPLILKVRALKGE